jgi:glutaredoxin-like protein NrdH
VDIKHVEGKKAGHIMMYALSTCGWCKKTKRLLNELGVEYHYTDVDLLEGKERRKAMEELEHWNPRCTFPTLVVKGKCIVGYKEDEIKEAIGP